ncbi:MAG: NADH-quinone oxidoreductase subunit NuoK [Deltaproteobacteria bacterium]|nr:NADH-quinone oxidoreductase subunit NuoK [Deltaproteobacteria bacterium]
MINNLYFFLTISALLFSLGITAIFYRKNIIAILIGVELVLNAASLNFVAFSRFTQSHLHGQVFALFIIIIAAAEAAVALAIVLRLFQTKETIDVEEANALRN